MVQLDSTQWLKVNKKAQREVQGGPISCLKGIAPNSSKVPNETVNVLLWFLR